jgi:hypothetical protein
MDLVREILLECEEQDRADGMIDIKIKGRSENEVNYHLMLLRDAGFIEASVLDTQIGPLVQPLRLTWSGHEFLSAARSSKLWEGAKEFSLKTTGALTLETLKLAIPHVTKLLMGV